MDKKVFRQIFKLAEPYLKKCRPEDFLHTKVAASLMEEIIAEEDLGAHADILTPAAILHDIGWSCIKKDYDARGCVIRTIKNRVEHMKKGSGLARKILEKIGYPEKKIKIICQLIANHDNRYINKPVRDELTKRLIEADDLWVLTWQAIDFYSEWFKDSPEETFKRHVSQVKKNNVLESRTALGIKRRLIKEARRMLK